MRKEVNSIIVPLGDISEDKNGEFIFTPNGKTVTIETTEIYADEGKVFLRDGKILSNHITLGTNDSEENYIEINE